jgi:CRISPR-associated protein Csd2
MTWQELVPADIQELYEIHDCRHAAAILAVEFPTEFAEVCEALRRFRFTVDEVKRPGGNESDMPKKFSALLRPTWEERQLSARLVVGEDEVVSRDTHKIDYVKNGVALDVEWNSKDQTFDRDLFAFRTFFEYDKISVGVLITRSNQLDPWIDSLGTYVDKHGDRRKYKDKFGASTTHMGQLLRRLKAGRHGGCPVLVFGITTRLLQGGMT